MQKLASKLISFQSDKDHPEQIRKCFDFVVSDLKKAGLFVKTFSKNGKPSLVATLVPVKNPEIILNGHLDVVPGKQIQFKPKIVGNRLYGRGTIDMKASLVVMMNLMKELSKKHKEKIKDRVGLMIVSDEEIGGFNGAKYLLESGYKPKFFLAGEPTDFNIGYQARGILWVKLTSFGKSAHGATPWEGENAVVKMTQALVEIEKLFPIPKKPVWKTTCNIASIHGGETANRVPDQCEVQLDIRYIPKDNPDEIVKKIRKNLPGIKVKAPFKEPPANNSKEDSYLRGLKNSIKKVMGKTPKFIKKHAASDGRHFSAAGVSSCVFGPIGRGQHSDNEWIDLKSLKTYYQILKDFVLSYS